MERDTVFKKIFFGVLDVVLITGAIVGVLTIDRGKWITTNPAFYQPPTPVEARQYPPLSLEALTGGTVAPPAPLIPLTGKICPVVHEVRQAVVVDESQIMRMYHDAERGIQNVAQSQRAAASSLCY